MAESARPSRLVTIGLAVVALGLVVSSWGNTSTHHSFSFTLGNVFLLVTAGAGVWFGVDAVRSGLLPARVLGGLAIALGLLRILVDLLDVLSQASRR